MRRGVVLLIALFFVQAAGLGELLHAGECHEPAACHAAGEGQTDSGEHGDCHWHCGTCVHPSALPVMNAGLHLSAVETFGPTLLQFLPTPPCDSIFHPPA